MEAQIHWFGMTWAVAVLICMAMAALLVLVARKVKRQGRPREARRLTLAALLEGSLVALDLVVQIGVSTLTDGGTWILDVWSLIRPVGHAIVLLLVVLAVRGLTAPAGSKGKKP